MTDTNPRPLKVFLSHAHADADAVRTLYDRLVADGVDAWLDKEKLIPGQDWKREIRKAVREADVVIVCLSKQFNREGYRQREVRWALDTATEKLDDTIFIIPARLEQCNVPNKLKKWHWVDLFDDAGYERLFRALRFRSKDIGEAILSKKINSSVSFPKQTNGAHTTESKKQTSKTAYPYSAHKNKRKTPYFFAIVGAIVILTIFGCFFASKWVNSVFPLATPTLFSVYNATYTPKPTQTNTPMSVSYLSSIYTPTLFPDKEAIPASYECADRDNLYLSVGTWGRTAHAGMGIYEEPLTSWDNNFFPIRTLPIGERVLVYDGPFCSDDGENTWWIIKSESSQFGWIMEYLPDGDIHFFNLIEQ